MQSKITEKAFLAEITKQGGSLQGASDWFAEAIRIGLSPDDTAASLASLCLEDEAANVSGLAAALGPAGAAPSRCAAPAANAETEN